MKKSIEIDLEVHRFIEMRRENFDESQNSILRRILGLDNDSIVRDSTASYFSLPPAELREPMAIAPGEQIPDSGRVEEELSLSEKIKQFHSRVSGQFFSAKPAAAREWQFGGVRLPEGTRLQKWYGGRKYEAEIRDGAIWFNGVPYQSPSAAAMVITCGSNVSGWNFWKYFDPAEGEWKKMSALKEQAQESNNQSAKI